MVLDSFRLLRVDTANQRLFSAVDDILYKMTFERVQSQAANAKKKHKTDSLAFYQNELDYMIPTKDSITKLISVSDTTKKYGILATCKVQHRKGNAIATDNIYYYLNMDMSIMNLDWIDSEVSQLSAKFNHN